ncbi:MAG: 16S rRNA (uracil(1498)-N(3))-methyltransferase [Puniceicoccales bacterium]|jgi:16S rRNA (uracil1498-N3)-methyltransferase|nr:16S rRNA (uracil(1498)-N(3))-methyltransferase [Puniceicoccales bacterium]
MHKCFYGYDVEVGILELSPSESHHLCNVMRARIGSAVTVLNGKGFQAYGILVVADGKCAQIEIERIDKIGHPSHPITLLQAVLKNSNNDHIVREATAIGVSEIIFFETQNTECKLRGKIDNKLLRWKQTAIEACKQSGNPFLPKISCFEKLESIDLLPFGIKLFGGLKENSQPIKKILSPHLPESNICMAIGPEGDFSPSEYAYLIGNGFIECRLTRHNVLRSETAAVYALSVLDQLTNF